eukprot:11554489-Heterocapsa_arctica.AAC.1
MAVVWSTHLPEQGSAVQSTESLSSGESKHYATIRATAHALGVPSMLADWGAQRDVRVASRCDSGVARRVPVCPGAGQMTAPDVRQLWLQQQ